MVLKRKMSQYPKQHVHGTQSFGNHDRVAVLSACLCRECYLRFCSQQFDLTNNNEAVHLSNNAIQCKYLNGERSGELPEENMWDVHQFKDYLR